MHGEGTLETVSRAWREGVVFGSKDPPAEEPRGWEQAAEAEGRLPLPPVTLALSARWPLSPLRLIPARWFAPVV